MDSYIVALSTFPSVEVASDIARQLVVDRLAACVNLVPSIRSIYTWNGAVCDDAEVLAVIKTRRERLEQLRAAIVSQHPYDCPEVIALDIADGHEPYLSWIGAMTSDVASEP